MKFPFWRRRRNEELDNEINDHLKMAIRERLERGESPENAKIHAQKELGNMGIVKEATRNSWGWRWLEQSGQDLSYGIRMLLKNPTFTLIAVITLTLGIGANTVIFSIVNAALFRPRPIADPERLVELYSGYAQQPYQTSSYQDFLRFREQTDVFSDLAAYSIRQFKLGGLNEVDQVWGEAISGNYFDLLGVTAFRGRTFLSEEDQTPGTPVVMISHGLWQRRFGSDPALIGKTITLNNQPMTVIGIAPPQYTGMMRGFAIEVWVPVTMIPLLEPQSGTAMLTSRGNSWLFQVGRLKPEVTVDQARARFDLLVRQLREEYPESWNEKREGSNETQAKLVTILPEKETRIHPDLHAFVYAAIALVLAIVNLVLLIACMNLANLLLARAAVRRKEIAIRLALGAGRFRIVRQLLTESVLLAVIAGAAATLLSWWAMNLLVASIPALPEGIRLAIDLRLDWNVLLYTLVFSLVVGVLFGLAPALQASRPDVNAALKSGSEGFTGERRQSLLRSGLIVAQVALSLLLLVGAGLVLQSVRNIRPISLGFDSLNMVVALIRLEEHQYNRVRSQDFYRQLTERTHVLPGVRAVSFIDEIPGGLLGWARSTIEIEGYQPAPGEDMQVNRNIIGAGYLTMMNITIVQGRDFDERDRDGAPCVTVVNEAFVKRYFTDGRTLGKHLMKLSWQKPKQSCEIIGVVHDDKFQSLQNQPAPWFAFPLLQSYDTHMTMLVLTAGEPDNLIPSVRRTIQSLDRDIPVSDVQTLSATFEPVLYFYRLFGLTVGACGLLAILLAIIGIYGVVAFTVSQRTREIGIRMALGADKQNVLRLVMRQGMILVASGLGIGLLLAMVLTRILTSSIFEINLLNGVSATDPLTFVVISILFAGVALLGCYIPGRRATRVDPMVALRYE